MMGVFWLVLLGVDCWFCAGFIGSFAISNLSDFKGVQICLGDLESIGEVCV